MALRDQINTVKGGAQALVGSGRLGNPIDPESIKHIYALATGTKFTETITKASVRQLQKEGKLVPLLDAYDVTWSNEENQVQTAPNSGTKSKSRQGLYEFTAMFDNGVFFQKVLNSMDGSNRWDFILIDDEDVMFGTTGKNDEFKGYKGTLMVNNYAFRQGTEGGKTSCTVQLTRSSEMNKDFGWVLPELLDFIPTDVDGVNQVRIDLGGLVSASTTITAKTVLDKDNSTYVGGLNAVNFLVKRNGATVTPTGVVGNAETKTYSITIPAPALAIDDKVEVKLYNSTANSSVIEVGTAPDEILYQSKEAIGVVTGA